MKLSYGWLFGLEGTPTVVSGYGATIRPANDAEAAYIRNSTINLFGSGGGMFDRQIARFPFVYELRIQGDNDPINPIVAILPDLLSRGEVVVPMRWVRDEENQSSGMAHTTGFFLHAFRAVNDRLEPVRMQDIEKSLRHAFEILGRRLSDEATSTLGRYVVSRLLDSKEHALIAGNDLQIGQRAADVMMLMEHLYHEGSKTEVLFRLGMSAAWLLGQSPAERAAIIDCVKTAYDLRSGRVHGSPLSNKPLKRETILAVNEADRTMRRTLMVMMLGQLTGDAFKKAFVAARLGDRPQSLDWAEWVG